MGDIERAWVFAGGDFSVDHMPRHAVQDNDLMVCVDAGVAYCLAAGYQPDLLVGDLDSTPPELLQDPRLANVEKRVFPSKKAASDLQLALEILVPYAPREVILLGVSGGRTDHMLFNWQLPLLQAWPFKMQLVDDTVHTYVLDGAQSITVQSLPGMTVSLLALRAATGVSTSGMQYPLQGARIELGSTLGLSNVVESQTISVEISSGCLLVMVQRTEKVIAQ